MFHENITPDPLHIILSNILEADPGTYLVASLPLSFLYNIFEKLTCGILCHDPEEYNHLRRHGGINYITPFDKLQRVSKLLS